MSFPSGLWNKAERLPTTLPREKLFFFRCLCLVCPLFLLNCFKDPNLGFISASTTAVWSAPFIFTPVHMSHDRPRCQLENALLLLVKLRYGAQIFSLAANKQNTTRYPKNQQHFTILPYKTTKYSGCTASHSYTPEKGWSQPSLRAEGSRKETSTFYHRRRKVTPSHSTRKESNVQSCNTELSTRAMRNDKKASNRQTKARPRRHHDRSIHASSPPPASCLRPSNSFVPPSPE